MRLKPVPKTPCNLLIPQSGLLEAGQRDHALAIGIVAKDILGLAKECKE